MSVDAGVYCCTGCMKPISLDAPYIKLEWGKQAGGHDNVWLGHMSHRNMTCLLKMLRNAKQEHRQDSRGDLIEGEFDPVEIVAILGGMIHGS